jgi:hypothetical protein
MLRHLPIAAALALTACAQPRAMRLGPPSSDIPPALHRVVQVRVEVDGGTGAGWATPVRPGRLLTVAHMAAEAGQWTDDAGRGGSLGLSWQDKRLAEFTATGEQPALVTISSALPGPQETVWWRYYIEPGDRPALAQGRVLGIDSDGDLHIDGMGAEGSSGSAILNSRGQLVGVMLGGWNPAGGVRDREMEMSAVVSILFRKVSFRPAAIAVPVAGAMPGPGSTR